MCRRPKRQPAGPQADRCPALGCWWTQDLHVEDFLVVAVDTAAGCCSPGKWENIPGPLYVTLSTARVQWSSRAALTRGTRALQQLQTEHGNRAFA